MTLKYEKTIRQGLNTIKGLIKSGLITDDDINAYKDIEVCGHKNTRIAMIIYSCNDCGKAEQVVIKNEYDLFADSATNIRRGLLDYATAEASGRFTADELGKLKQIITCEHTNRRIVKCCGGTVKEECKDCGRRFADKSQWILTHETEV